MHNLPTIITNEHSVAIVISALYDRKLYSIVKIFNSGKSDKEVDQFSGLAKKADDVLREKHTLSLYFFYFFSFCNQVNIRIAQQTQTIFPFNIFF
jgi:hypothetical protein